VLAQNNLGGMYADGRGVPQDYVEALKWVRMAADQGLSNAQGRLGEMYDKGQGVLQDYQQAVAWYRKAAEQGLALAQFSLGVKYVDGHGVAQDYVEAAKWFRTAADQGMAAAQYNLGLLYDGGVGVTEDEEQAATWYRKAADQGDDEAKKKLAELEATRRCERLAGSNAYFVATCVVGGMEKSRQVEGIQAAKIQVGNAQAGLRCTPEALSKLQQKSNRAATTILGSGAISRLMDFSDAMTLECKKAAASILKRD